MSSPFKNISDKEFRENFSTQESCLEFLAQQKWGDSFVCRKCGHTNYCEGKTPFSRRCTKCKHDESAKVGTLFEGCRFPLTKAFYIAYTVCNGATISTHEISRQLELRQMTCWSFKKKLQECVAQNSDISMERKIEIEKILLQTK